MMFHQVDCAQLRPSSEIVLLGLVGLLHGPNLGPPFTVKPVCNDHLYNKIYYL